MIFLFWASNLVSECYLLKNDNIIWLQLLMNYTLQSWSGPAALRGSVRGGDPSPEEGGPVGDEEATLLSLADSLGGEVAASHFLPVVSHARVYHGEVRHFFRLKGVSSFLRGVMFSLGSQKASGPTP